jgi:hypothetical protein
MTTNVILSVSFPSFGKNYFSQDVVMSARTAKARTTLIEDKRFDNFLIPAAERHFSNGVVGFNDQFRFLHDILDAHLVGNAPSAPLKRPAASFAQRA